MARLERIPDFLKEGVVNIDENSSGAKGMGEGERKGEEGSDEIEALYKPSDVQWGVDATPLGFREFSP